MRLRSFALGVLLLSVCVQATPAALEHYLQFDAMARLANATSREELERARAVIVCGDSAVDIVYALVLYKLEPSDKAERLLLDSIPASQLEFNFFFFIMYREGCAGNAPPKLCNLPDEYLPALGQVVARYPEHYGAFLLLSYFADGYIKDDLDSVTQSLYEANPEVFKQTIAATRPEIARTVYFEDHTRAPDDCTRPDE